MGRSTSLWPVAIAVGVVLAVLVAIGPPRDRRLPPPPPPAPAQALPSVTAGGTTLTSAAIELPADPQVFPAGAGAEVADRVCTACHSPAMILTQPPLTSAQWTAEIRKMAEVYKARITPEDAETIHAYLVALTADPAEAIPDPS